MFKNTSKLGFVALMGVMLATPAVAGLRDQAEVRTGKTELVVPGMSAQDVAEKVKDALSSWSIPVSANVRSLPATLPVVPGQPRPVEVVYGGTPTVMYQCSQGYAEIVKRPPGVNNTFMKAFELTQACVYPFEKGVKVYVMFTSVKHTESLTSGLFNGITQAIRGKDADYIGGQLKETTDAIRKNLPSVLVARIEVPGAEVQEPDHDAVAALIPATAPVQPVPVRVVAAAPAAAVGSPDAKIEARKNLTAMGLSYFAQDQFIGAIRRKDEVAVKLFLDGGGVDVSARDKTGKTPVDIAKEVGAADLAQLISSYAAGSVSQQVFKSTATAIIDAFDLAAMTAQLDVAEAKLAPETRAAMQQSLAGARAQGATPRQLAMLRRQLLSLYPESASLVKDINPETGRLASQ